MRWWKIQCCCGSLRSGSPVNTDFPPVSPVLLWLTITDFWEVKLSEVPPLEPVGSIGNVTGHSRLSITNHCPWVGEKTRKARYIDLSSCFQVKHEANLGSVGGRKGRCWRLTTADRSYPPSLSLKEKPDIFLRNNSACKYNPILRYVILISLPFHYYLTLTECHQCGNVLSGRLKETNWKDKCFHKMLGKKHEKWEDTVNTERPHRKAFSPWMSLWWAALFGRKHLLCIWPSSQENISKREASSRDQAASIQLIG